MKIAVVQMKPKLGNINYNANEILNFYKKSIADIILLPEMCLTGYLPKDTLLSSKFIEKCHKKLEDIMKHIGEKVCIVSMPYLESEKLYNAVVVLQNQKIIACSFKTHLPNYDIFDEKRYFSSGNAGFFELNGIKIGLPVCEDIWYSDVCDSLVKQGVNMLLVANASPFYYGKIQERLTVVKQRYAENNIPIIYCNQVLCQDGIIYDGTSFCFDGANIIYAKSFEEDILEVEFRNGQIMDNRSTVIPSDEILTYSALVFGLQEYVKNSGFEKVVIGLSGGADSAIVTVLAVRAFGADNIKTALMPSKFTSKESIEDATQLAKNLGVEMQTISIEKPLASFHEILKLSGIASENIQARIRGNILMAISNKENAMVLTTGNKSEIAVGYCTIYGDMCGGYNPIKDLYKTQVFAIMKFINEVGIANIPERIITKEPSAELKENQKDSDFLPRYEILDAILFELIENNKQPEELGNFDAEIVKKVWKLINTSEYKKFQSAPGTKISKRSFEPSEWRKNIV
jgi:NAD+ synthetase